MGRHQTLIKCSIICVRTQLCPVPYMIFAVINIIGEKELGPSYSQRDTLTSNWKQRRLLSANDNSECAVAEITCGPAVERANNARCECVVKYTMVRHFVKRISASRYIFLQEGTSISPSSRISLCKLGVTRPTNFGSQFHILLVGNTRTSVRAPHQYNTEELRLKVDSCCYWQPSFRP